jgi:hypothetical protein
MQPVIPSGLRYRSTNNTQRKTKQTQNKTTTGLLFQQLKGSINQARNRCFLVKLQINPNFKRWKQAWQSDKLTPVAKNAFILSSENQVA